MSLFIVDIPLSSSHSPSSSPLATSPKSHQHPLFHSFLPVSTHQMADSFSPNGDAASYNGIANGSASAATNHSGLPPVIRKKLMGYVGFANLPNQVHRKSVRKGFQFTVMVVGQSPLFFSPSSFFPSSFFSLFSILKGESGLGKSTLVNTLFNTTLYPPKEVLPPQAERPKTVAIESISAGPLPLSHPSIASLLIFSLFRLCRY